MQDVLSTILLSPACTGSNLIKYFTAFFFFFIIGSLLDFSLETLLVKATQRTDKTAKQLVHLT